MQNELTDLQLRHIIDTAEIDTPIVAHRIVGSRVELTLLGGTIVQADNPFAAPDLSQLKVKELKQIAKQLQIPGHSKMNQDQLIAAIQEAQT